MVNMLSLELLRNTSWTVLRFSVLKSSRAIRDYVELEAIGEKVQHLVKVKTENILDRNYDCWDVYTTNDRYWVISWPTSLYSHRYFPRLDYTLSFHVGVTFHLLSRQRGLADDKDKSVLHPVWRRWEDADVPKDPRHRPVIP